MAKQDEPVPASGVDELDPQGRDRLLQQQAGMAQALSRIGSRLDTAPAGLIPALEATCLEIRSALSVSAAVVQLLNDDTGLFDRVAQVGLPAVWLERHPPLAKQVIDDHRHLWTPMGVFEGAAIAHMPQAALYAELQLSSLVQSVLRDRGESFGLLSVLTFGNPRRLTDHERIWLECVGHRVAQAVRTARLSTRIAISEARFRDMVTSCLEGIGTMDADARVTFANPQLSSMLGWTPEEMLGRVAQDFICDVDRDVATRMFTRVRGGLSDRRELRLLHRDGRELTAVVSASPLDGDQGRLTGVVSFVSDITEQRRLETRMQQAHKLESLGLLAGGIAHDFNNLLVGILGNAQIAGEMAEPGSPLTGVVGQIETSAQRAADLTRQLLAYAGQGSVARRAVMLNDLVRDTVPLVTPAMGKHAQLRLRLSADLPVTKGDPTELRQVIMNLLTNAAEAIGARPGRIELATSVCQGSVPPLPGVERESPHEDDRFVCLEVRDDGVGMDLVTQQKMFDPFFTTKFTGRGLGLATVLGIVRAHQGTVRVDSQVGKGATFRVFLPAARAPATLVMGPAQQTGDPATPAETPRDVGLVLVVDDEQAVRDVARLVLERAGFRVVCAGSAHEALLRFEEQGPAIGVAVLDVTMQDRSGHELLELLRARRPNLKAVLSSGYDAQASVRHEHTPPAVFLQKPWTGADLVAAIREATRG